MVKKEETKRRLTMAQAHLSDKENYLRVLNGKIPEFVPQSLFFPCMVTPPPLNPLPVPARPDEKE